MSARAAYLETSAITALILDGPAAAELTTFLRGMGDRLTSVIARAEVIRQVAVAEPGAVARASEVMTRLSLVELDGGVVATASSLRPPTLGISGAIHIASALLLADALDAFVTYDPGIAAAARRANLPVGSPGVQMASPVAEDEGGDEPVGPFDAGVVQRVVDRLVGRLRPSRIILPDDAAPGGTLQLTMVPGPWSPGRGAIWIGQEAIEDLDIRLDLALVDEDTPEPAGRVLYELAD